MDDNDLKLSAFATISAFPEPKAGCTCDPSSPLNMTRGPDGQDRGAADFFVCRCGVGAQYAVRALGHVEIYDSAEPEELLSIGELLDRLVNTTACKRLFFTN